MKKVMVQVDENEVNFNQWILAQTRRTRTKHLLIFLIKLMLKTRNKKIDLYKTSTEKETLEVDKTSPQSFK